jgi:hypothetical protein
MQEVELLKPRCLNCSYVILLEKTMYSDYNGPVYCPRCGFKNHTVFALGTLLTMRHG